MRRKKLIDEQKRKRMRQLVDAILKAADAYYNEDDPIMSDSEYDRLHEELKKLERETGVVFSGISPASA